MEQNGHYASYATQIIYTKYDYPLQMRMQIHILNSFIASELYVLLTGKHC